MANREQQNGKSDQMVLVRKVQAESKAHPVKEGPKIPQKISVYMYTMQF